jgi:DNA-binding MurR/RpiR family transcriptional regulator
MTHKLYLQHFKNVSAKDISKKVQTDCEKFTDLLREEIKEKKIAAIDVIFDKNDLQIFENFSKKIASHKKVLVLGVGGSSLGGKTLSALKFQDKLEFLRLNTADLDSGSERIPNYWWCIASSIASNRR